MPNLKTKSNRSPQKRPGNGFSLTEMIVTVAIAGAIGAVATPTYINQSKANCQRAAESQLSQILATTQVFHDEYGEPPTGWADLDKVTTLMTTSGAAANNSFSAISLPSCNYEFSGSEQDGTLLFIANPPSKSGSQPIDPNNPAEPTSQNKSFNVAACINTSTGASDLRKGDASTAANTENLNC